MAHAGQYGSPSPRRRERWSVVDRAKVLALGGVLAIVVLALFAALPGVLQLVGLIGAGVWVHRTRGVPLRRAAAKLSGFAVFDNVPVAERTGTARWATSTGVAFRTRAPGQMSLEQWIAERDAADRLPSPEQVLEHFPDVHPGWLAEYAQYVAARRQERTDHRKAVAGAATRKGLAWAATKVWDLDGERAAGRMARELGDQERQEMLRRQEQHEFYARANKAARKRERRW